MPVVDVVNKTIMDFLVVVGDRLEDIPSLSTTQDKTAKLQANRGRKKKEKLTSPPD